jgi:hypothetical protein
LTLPRRQVVGFYNKQGTSGSSAPERMQGESQLRQPAIHLRHQESKMEVPACASRKGESFPESAPRPVSLNTSWLFRFILSESSSGYKRAQFGLLVVFAALTGALIVLGAPPVAGGPWDTDSILDGGWRIVNGQVPHIDFHMPLGSLTYLLAAFGMKVAPPSTASITYGNILLAVLLAPAAWYLASARFSWLIASFFVFFEGLYLITPRPPGYPIRYTSYAMSYNRQGYVMVALICLCVLLRRRNPTVRTQLCEGVIAGAILALLLYCKITYFVAGAAIAVLGMVIESKSWRWLASLAGAFSGACAAFWLFLHVSLVAYAKDVLAAAPVQSPQMRMRLLAEGLQNNLVNIYLLAFALALCSLPQHRLAGHRFPVLRLWLIGAVMIATSLWILSGNASQGGGVEDPMYFLAILLVTGLFARQTRRSMELPGSGAPWVYTACLLIVPLFSFPILAGEIASTGYAIAWDLVKRPHYNPAKRIHSAQLQDFYVPVLPRRCGPWPISEYPARINDGIDLLRANSQPNDRITTVEYVNPFSFALHTHPAHNGLLWWDFHFSFSETHYPPAQEFLGDTSLVIVPRNVDQNLGCDFTIPDLMLKLYGSYLQSHFHEIASTNTWILYRSNIQPLTHADGTQQ